MQTIETIAASPQLTCFEQQLVERLQAKTDWSERELMALALVVSKYLPRIGGER
jgi:hypothetical protein